MISEESLFSRTELILNQLIQNAQMLCTTSQGEIAEDTLAPLQLKQKELIAFLMEIDSIFIESRKTMLETLDTDRWSHIQTLLNSFQKLNNSFINNLNIRKGLVANELKSLQSSKHSLSKFNSVYTAVEEKKRHRVNTVK